jgi:hypothetical protein
MELESDFQCELGLAWAAAKGYSAPEVEVAFSQAHELCLRTGKTAELGRVVGGLASFHWVRGNLSAAKALVLEFLQNRDAASDYELSMMMHGMLGCILSDLGELSESEAHLEIAHRLYTPQRQLSAVLRFGDDGVSISRNYHANNYHRALAWSRERNDKWDELNAALRLARLCRTDGRAGVARDLLAPVYGWFTEGFDNPVSRDAKALLEELTGTIDSAAISDYPADPRDS